MQLNTNSPHEILEALDATYEIETSPIYVGNITKKITIDPNRHAVQIDRPDGVFILGYPSKDWKPLQPIDFVKSMCDLAKQSNGSISAGYSIGQGEAISIEVSLPDSSYVKFGDDYEVSLIGYLSNAPGHGVNFRLKSTRLVCTNGLTSRISVGNKIISHVQDLKAALVKVPIALLQKLNTIQETLSIARETKLSQKEALSILLKLFQTSEDFEEDRIPYTANKAHFLFCQGKAIGSELLGEENGLLLLNCVTEVLTHHVVRNTLEAAVTATIFDSTRICEKLITNIRKAYSRQSSNQPVAVKSF